MMKCVVIRGKHDYRIEEKTVPKPGPGEVLVKVAAVGICAGDSKCWDGGVRFWGDGANVAQWVETGTTPGHEFSGTVVALGEGAGERHGVEVGDLTVSENIVPCKECRYCQRGSYQMCMEHYIYGFRHVSQVSLGHR